MMMAFLLGGVLAAPLALIACGLAVDRTVQRALLDAPVYSGHIVSSYHAKGRMTREIDLNQALMAGTNLYQGRDTLALHNMRNLASDVLKICEVVANERLLVQLQDEGRLVRFPALLSTFTDLHSVVQGWDGSVTICVEPGTEVVLIDKRREIAAVGSSSMDLKFGSDVQVKPITEYNNMVKRAKASTESRAPEMFAAAAVAFASLAWHFRDSMP